MAKINVLDSSVFNKIAAGEVVERPASVVKELVENCIDAGATTVQISIENGGISKIRIVDNGSGIEKDSIKTAFLPHATSKIKTVEDLFNIGSLGFRGEALASIASVSQISIISKTDKDEVGSCLELDGGRVVKETEVGAPTGTNICVENLFFNVPVRYKFLKKPKQEEQEITNLISRIILSNPSVSIKYVADGKEIYNHKSGEVIDAIFTVYGKEAVMNVLPVDNVFNDFRITGYVGKPSFSKPNRTYQTLILNGRIIENSMISLATSNAYGETLMKRQYPFFVLNLYMPNEMVDVNVHPSKKEVRFENSNRIFGAIYTAVLNAITKQRDIKQIENIKQGEKETGSQDLSIEDKNIENSAEVVNVSKVETSSPQNTQKVTNSSKNAEISHNFNNFNYILRKNMQLQNKVSDVFTVQNFEDKLNEFSKEDKYIPIKESEEVREDTKETQIEIDKIQPTAEQEKITLIETEKFEQDKILTESSKILGTLFNTYILIEIDNNLLMVDQHAGHEKLLYDKMMEMIEQKSIEIQQLMFPEFVKVNSIEKNYIEEFLPTIRELGFEIDEFGDDCYKISAVPLLLSDINIKEFWNKILADLKDFSKKSMTSFLKDEIAQKACKSAVKAGDALSKDEIDLLLKSLSNEKVALHCPHGRPIVIKLTKTEIEKWFKRIV